MLDMKLCFKNIYQSNKQLNISKLSSESFRLSFAQQVHEIEWNPVYFTPFTLP
jgi:hypothetical protein